MTINAIILLMFVACGNKESDTATDETNTEETETTESETAEGSEESEETEESDSNSSEDSNTPNNDEDNTDETETETEDPSTIDADQDGVFADEDCNDNNPSQPLKDQDCDGILTIVDCDDNDHTTINDMDCDGYATNNDCDDSNDSINPGASDSSADGIDQDCDGTDGPQTQSSSCPSDEIEDCNGNCAPSDWLGDGWCDSGFGFWGNDFIYFDCEQFNNDDGDC